MVRLSIVLVCMCATAVLSASNEQAQPAGGRNPASPAAFSAPTGCVEARNALLSKGAGSANVFTVANALQSACAACGDRCAARTRACQDGSVKACYEAAACLCECNLAAGGCGSSKDALEECVRENRKAAEQLR